MGVKANSVLIVDNDAAVIRVLMGILNQDYIVYAERDSRNCLDVVKRLRPDLILLDILMPEIDGYEVLKTLKEDSDSKDIPVIFVTGLTESENEVKGLALGAADYINKPFNAPVVKMRVKSQMKIVNQMRKIQSLKEAEELERQRKEQERINKRIRLVLDSAPISVSLYNSERTLIDCNMEAVKLFGFENKEQFIKARNERFFDIFPQQQPCGSTTRDKIDWLYEKIAEKGYIQLEWAYLTADGEDLPAELTFVRIEHCDTIMFVAYVHDLREKIKMEKLRLEILEESNKAKSRFLARMSHEIRTPISAIMGISELQLRGQTMSPHTEDAFVKIYDSSKMLLNIVNDVLDFSRIESGKMPLIDNEYEAASLVGDAAQLSLVYLERKNISFQMHVDENLPAKLIGDVLRIRQIISNVLTNAFKYTESGMVTLSLQCEEGHDGYVTLVISIQDTGNGMTIEQINAIKGEYVRLHDQDKLYTIGTGLGIPIVYSLVQMMNAQFELNSDIGKGTHAIIRIPQKASGTELVGPELARSLQDFKSGTRRDHKDLEFVPEQMTGRVLAVDDVDINLHVVEAMLETFGLTIDLSKNGQDAIDKIRQGNVYDIILMDYMMPGMDGIEATKILRGMGYDHPIVALTANALKGQAEMFMDNGFSGFMAKPIDIKLLNSYLVRFIKNKPTQNR